MNYYINWLYLYSDAYRPQHLHTIRLQLLGSNAADALQIVQRLRRALGDGGQRRVVEDHVGGQVVLARHLGTPGFEGGEARLRGVVQRDGGFGQGGLAAG